MKDSRFIRGIAGFFAIFSNYTWSFVIIISLTIISSIFSIHYINLLENEFDQVYLYDVAGRTSIKDAYSMVLRIDDALKDLRIKNEKTRQEETLKFINSNIITVTNLIEVSGWRFSRQDEKKIYNSARADLSEFIKTIDSEIAGLAYGGQVDDDFLSSLGVIEARLLSEFNRLTVIKRNSIGSVFRNIKLQLGTSLVLTSLLLVSTVIVRVIMYINGRNRNKTCK
jgi:hypothetical protein